MTTPSDTALSAEWATLRDSLSKAYVAADIDAALRYSRPRIEAAARSQPATEGLRERIDALTSPARYENDRNGNWWTTDMEYGWDEAIAAVLAALAATEPAGDER